MVDLSHLSQPQLKFLTLTHQYREGEAGSDLSLSAFSPDVCIMFARYFGLDTANFEMIEVSDVEKRMARVREGRDYEGEVLYFMDSNNNTLGLLKKKTTWYIILRAIREKVSHVWSTYRYYKMLRHLGIVGSVRSSGSHHVCPSICLSGTKFSSLSQVYLRSL